MNNNNIINEKKEKENQRDEKSKYKEVLDDLWLEKIKDSDLLLTKEGRMLKFGPYKTYINNVIDELKRKKQITPKWRINYIFSGDGGCGKSTFAKRLAFLLSNKTEKGFEIGDYDANFNNYNNEKTLIWDEFELDKIKSYGTAKFLKITDSNEDNDFYINIKYGTTKLSNNFNIITTNEDVWQILDRLSKNTFFDQETNGFKIYKNPEKITRRFPYIFIFKKIEDKSNIYVTKIDFYKFETNKNDEFCDKYKLIKTWEKTTTPQNFKKVLNDFLKELYIFTQKNVEILEQQQNIDDIEWEKDADEILESWEKIKANDSKN